MNELILKKNIFFSYFYKSNSEKLGYYFSFLLHSIILLFAFGLPNFFDRAPITLPNIIPIEIINVDEVTNISQTPSKEKEKKIEKDTSVNKKFNNSSNQEVMKIEEKPKKNETIKESENLKTIKDDILIEKKVKTPIKLEEEKKNLPDQKIESLPSKKIKPKIKPKPESEIIVEKKKTDVIVKAMPKQKPDPKFSIASMLKDLRNEQSSLQEDNVQPEKEEKKTVSEESADKEENLQLSISEIDLLRQQLTSCWIAPAGAVIEKGMIVKISAKIKKNRRINENSIRIIDTNISKNNAFYGPITESAMRTLLNPDCIPLKLPQNKYELWKSLTITFDYSIMKGYQ